MRKIINEYWQYGWNNQDINEHSLTEDYPEEQQYIEDQRVEESQIENPKQSTKKGWLLPRKKLHPLAKYEADVSELNVLETYKEATSNKKAKQWKAAIKEKLRIREIKHGICSCLQFCLQAKQQEIQNRFSRLSKTAKVSNNKYKTRVCAKDFTQ